MITDVVVVGGGLAALEIVLALKRRRPGISVKVISPQAEIIFRPWLIYQPACGLVAPRIPFRTLLHDVGADVIPETARDVDLEEMQVRLEDGTSVGYRQLVVATGAVADRDRTMGARDHALFPCDTDDAGEFAKRISSGKPRVAIIFGWDRPGPGLEYAAWIAARRPDISLTVIDGDGTLDRRFGERATARVKAIFERRGARLLIGQRLGRIGQGQVELADTTIRAEVIAVVAPLRGNTGWLPKTLLDANGRLRVSSAMQSASGVFGIGDAVVAPEGYRLPPALMSIRATAGGVARNVIGALDGAAPEPVLKSGQPDMLGPDLAGTGVFVRDRQLIPAGRLMLWLFKSRAERRYLRMRKADAPDRPRADFARSRDTVAP